MLTLKEISILVIVAGAIMETYGGATLHVWLFILGIALVIAGCWQYVNIKYET